MRPKGDGSLFERSPGVWVLRVSITDPATGRRIRPQKTVHTAKRGGLTQARAELKKFVKEVEEREPEPEAVTFRHVADEWVELLPGRGRSPSTIDTYRSHLTNHVYPALGELDVREVTAQRLDRLYASLQPALSASTVAVIHWVISGALKQAKRWKLLTEMPEATPPTRQPAEVEPPTPEQVVALYEGAKQRHQDCLAALIYVAAMTGLRRGELCGLQVGDLDWDTRILKVDRQIRPHHGEGGPKQGSRRVVALGPRTVEILQEWLAAERGRWGEHRGPWLFSNDGGDTHLDPRRVSEAIADLGKALGIPVHTHAFRHFHSTYGAASGVDVVTMAKRAGHTVDMATQVYMHRVAEADRAAASVIERALGV